VSFLDKVKETAAKAGEGVRKGAAQVKDKVGNAQLQKRANDDAKQIGYLIVAEKTEGTAPPAREIDRLVAEIVDLRTRMAEKPETPQKPEGPVQAESAPATPTEEAATTSGQAAVAWESPPDSDDATRD
jgi:hypothetical protein